MVSMVVVAVGILAVLGVQSRTLADTQTAVHRAQAIRLIDDLSEHMQANPSALKNIDAYESPFADQYGPDTPTSPDCGAGACTAAELAQHDLIEWKKAVARTLPGGAAALFKVAGEAGMVGGNRQLGVMVAWRKNEAVDVSDLDDDPFAMANRDEDGGYGSDIKNAANSSIACPDDHICHLQYLQLTSRCTTDELADSLLLCADGLHLMH